MGARVGRGKVSWLANLVLALALALPANAAPATNGQEAMAHRPEAPWTRDLFPSTYRPLPRADTLVTHATILDGKGHRFDDGDVLLREGKVAAIGHALASQGARIIDAHGRWVTPGLIDVHSHDGTYVLPQTALDAAASDVSELSSPDAAGTWIASAVNPQDPSFPAALAGGVTTMQILPGSDPVFGGQSVILHPIPAATVQAMEMPGAPQGLKMACGENPKVLDAAKGRGPTSRQGEIAFIRSEFAKAERYRRDWVDYLSLRDDGGAGRDRGRSHHPGGWGDHPPGDGHNHLKPPEDDPTLDTLVRVLDGSIAVHMHCYRSDEMAVMMDLSKAIGFRVAAFHHAIEAYKIAPLLAANGICAAVWSDWWGFKMEALDGIRENAAFVDAAPGGCAMMHSDSPFLGQWLNIEAGKAAAAGRSAGLPEPPEHVIAWITANPARAMGIADRVGSLVPGKDADLVIWSGDPFSVMSHADVVMIDGAVAYDRTDPRYRPRSDFTIGRDPVVPR